LGAEDSLSNVFHILSPSPVGAVEKQYMGKQLKQIDDQIAQINDPRFGEDRNMWVMMVYP
jgi:hypothetical protein